MAVLTTKSQPRVLVAVNSFIPHFHRKALGAALGAVVAGLSLTAGQARALVVTTYSGLDYEVTTFTGSYNDNVSKFNTPTNGGLMPWWGNEDLASQFTGLVSTYFGTPNNSGFAGPYFAFETYFSNGLYVTAQTMTPSYLFPNGKTGVNPTVSVVWAQATLIPATSAANVPGPLPALGLAAAFGFSRKLRKRIKLHQGTSAVSTSPGA